MSEIDCTVMGRKSYEIIAEHDKDFFSTYEYSLHSLQVLKKTQGNVMFKNENPVDVVRELKTKIGQINLACRRRDACRCFA